MPVSMQASAASGFTYPVQEFRFGIYNTDRNINISGTDNGAYLSSAVLNGTDYEKWYLNYISAGVYEIVNVQTGYVITNDNGLATIAPDQDAANQRWNITSVGKDCDGYDLYYKVTSNANNSIALTFNVNSNSLSVDSYTGDGYQKFKLNLDGLEGYAANCMTTSGEKAGTIGGLLGPTVFVSTADDLVKQLDSVGAQTVVITADIDMQSKSHTRIRDNKTIVGSYSKHTIYDSQFRTNDTYGAVDDSPSDNIVFRNLDMEAKNVPNRILINIWSSRQIWIDHINFNSTLSYDRTGNGQDEVGKFIWINTPYESYYDAKDRLRSPDFVTISYCKFTHRYWTVAYGTQNDEITRDHTTLLYNWWNECVRRTPQLGNGSAHIYCNYFNGYDSNGSGTAQIIGGDGSDMVSENCRFQGFSQSQALSMGGGSDPARDSNSYLSTSVNGTPSKISFSPKVTSSWYPNKSNYGYSLSAAYNTSNTDVKAVCTAYAGCFTSDAGIKYITDSDMAKYVATTYPSPFLKSIEVGNDPVGTVKIGAVLNTDAEVSYTIRNVNSGLYLSVEGGTPSSGANVSQSASADTWQLVDAGDGYYYVYSTLGNGSFCIDLPYGSTDNGTSIGLWANDESDARKFKFVDNGDGSYLITTKCTADASCFGVVADSKETGADVVQWVCNDNNSQKWILDMQIAPLSGSLIAELARLDMNYYQGWSIDTDMQIGDLVFGDRDVTYTALPQELIGAEGIVTACDSKNSSGDLAILTLSADSTVYIALDSRVTTVPAWLTSYTKTDLTATNNKDVTFVIYMKQAEAGEQLTLGENGQSSGCVGYTVFVQETKSDPPASATMRGDADCNGVVELGDAVLLAKSLSQTDGGGLTAQGKLNSDCNDDTSINSEDLSLLLQYLSGRIKW